MGNDQHFEVQVSVCERTTAAANPESGKTSNSERMLETKKTKDPALF
jgi:hypothetical protein